jgi:hypothetical protein
LSIAIIRSLFSAVQHNAAFYQAKAEFEMHFAFQIGIFRVIGFNMRRVGGKGEIGLKAKEAEDICGSTW